MCVWEWECFGGCGARLRRRWIHSGVVWKYNEWMLAQHPYSSIIYSGSKHFPKLFECWFPSFGNIMLWRFLVLKLGWSSQAKKKETHRAIPRSGCVHMFTCACACMHVCLCHNDRLTVGATAPPRARRKALHSWAASCESEHRLQVKTRSQEPPLF